MQTLSLEKFYLLPAEQQEQVLAYIELLFEQYQNTYQNQITGELQIMTVQEVEHLEQEFENEVFLF